MKLPFNCIHDNIDPLPPLGKKVDPPAPAPKPDWTPVRGKPDLYESPDGKYKYEPKTPPAKLVEPVLAPAPVKQGPATNNEEWRSDTPEKDGWYNASVRRMPKYFRYWNGSYWSKDIGKSCNPLDKIERKARKAPDQYAIEWRDIQPDFPTE